MSDQERSPKTYIEYFPKLDTESKCGERMSKVKTYEGLVDLICESKVVIGVGQGDYYSNNEGYPYRINTRAQRRRMWFNKGTGKVFRIEMSKTLVDSIFEEGPIEMFDSR